MAKCKICNEKYHSCSSCNWGDRPEMEYSLCYRCWKEHGFEVIYEDAEKRCEAIRGAMYEEIKEKKKKLLGGGVERCVGQSNG